MNHKIIEGYARYVSADEVMTSTASAPEVSPTPATPISTLSFASFVGGVTTYNFGC
ncbi:hypothetical protein [Microbacterium sp. BH-3-3-3]|uniref:hypothetical protein n=1 Tax=Microbacterium sp. BH-3-3-3 TaxID=1906742 RepID=UPI0015E175E8|nr:hypothetical protein [Microbacterium sp. BH-3-3-3]